MGSRPGVDKNLGGVLIAGGSSRTPLNCCQSTLGQDNKPPNAQIGPGRGSNTSCDHKPVCDLLGFFDLSTLDDFLEEDNKHMYSVLGH